MQLTPSALAFPGTSLSATSPAQNLVLQNTGGTVVTLQSVTVTGTDFVLALNTCGSSLAPQTSCTVSLLFHPGALGVRSGTVTVADSLGTQTATLSGTATAPATDALSSTSLAFPITQVGSGSSPQSLILTNAGDVPLTLVTTAVTKSAAAVADFSATNSCGNSLAAHSACAITVTFNPHTVGASSAILSVSDVYRTQAVTLSGTAIAPPGISLLPSSTVTFPSTGVGSSSTPQLLTLTNNGGLPLLIGSVSLTGDFQLAATGSTCSVALAPATACTVAVVFSPTASGLRDGALTIADNAPASQANTQAGLQTVPLTGTAIDFALAADGPTSLTVISGKPATFPLLLSTPANLSGIVTLACTGAPANSVCTISPNTLPLNNSAPTLVTVTLATGQSTTTQTALLAPLGKTLIGQKRSTPSGTSTTADPTRPQEAVISTTTDPTRLQEAVIWATADPTRPQEAVISTTTDPTRLQEAVISTEAQRSGEIPSFAKPPQARAATAALALLLPLGLFAFRRTGSLPTLLALVAAVLFPFLGCSSTPRQIPPAATAGGTSTASATPTPSGTYTLTVTATSAGLSRSINLVVTVQ